MADNRAVYPPSWNQSQALGNSQTGQKSSPSPVPKGQTNIAHFTAAKQSDALGKTHPEKQSAESAIEFPKAPKPAPIISGGLNADPPFHQHSAESPFRYARHIFFSEMSLKSVPFMPGIFFAGLNAAGYVDLTKSDEIWMKDGDNALNTMAHELGHALGAGNDAHTTGNGHSSNIHDILFHTQYGFNPWRVRRADWSAENPIIN